MRHSQTLKFQQVLDPVPGAADQSCEPIDTRGFQTLAIIVGNNNADAMSDFRLTESDSVSGFTNIPGTVYGTDAVDVEGNSCPLATTGDDDHLFVFLVDLVDRKRFIRPEITTEGTGDRTYCLAIGFEPGEPSLLTNDSMAMSAADIGHVVIV